MVGINHSALLQISIKFLNLQISRIINEKHIVIPKRIYNKKLENRYITRIKKEIRKNMFINSKKLGKIIESPVSDRHLRRIIKKLKFTNTKMQTKPYLKKSHIQKRLSYAKDYVDFGNENWKKTNFR